MNERVVAYVDGFNLYHGVKQKLGRGYLWIDVQGLVGSLLRPNQTLESVKYFTARVRRPRESHDRQAAYLDAISSFPSVTIIEGYLQANSHRCPHCRATTIRHEEKKTDVNIACAMLLDAAEDMFDTALVVSADSDLSAPIVAVRRAFSKRAVAMFPPGRVSAELRKVASGYFSVSESKVRAAQLPETIEVGGVSIHRRGLLGVRLTIHLHETLH